MEQKLNIPSGMPEDYVPTGTRGLTRQEVRERRAKGLGNTVSAEPGKTIGQIAAGNLFTLFNLLNVILAICLAAVGSYRNMLFMGVVVSNTLIGTVQEIRVHRVIRRLKLMNAPLAHVIREGTEETAAPEELVRGDLIVLHAGDQVPADALVREGAGAVDESLLTGESEAALKRPLDWLLSGSYITQGRFVAQLVYVGDESYAAALSRSAKKIKRPESVLLKGINGLLRMISYVLLPLGLMLFAKQYYLDGAALNAAVTSSAAAVIGMIPEGLALLTSIAMAVGVIRLAGQGTLVQELCGIETLSHADILCLDKTGTITTGAMKLDMLVPLDADESEMRAALSRFLAAFDDPSATLNALRDAVKPGTDRPVSTVPFSAQRKMSQAVFEDGTAIALGAPDFFPDVVERQEAKRRIGELTQQGRRVLALVKTDAKGERRVLGLAALSDRMRPNVRETLGYFDRQGVAVRIISGDDPRTVSAIAKRAGVRDAQKWVNAATLDSEEDIARAAGQYVVFGRVTPGQKEQLVNAMKRMGHHVAMIGDGVNDIPALKAADCSIAMADGSDAARHTAQITLLNTDFSALPGIVGEGRRVVNNITRSASLFLMKTLYSFALTAALLVLPAAYPFQPIQLTLVSALCIGVPGFLLALEPDTMRTQGDFLRTALCNAAPGAAAVTVCAAASMLLENMGFSAEVCSTLATLSAAVMGLVRLADVCRPFTKLRWAILAGMACAMAGAVCLASRLFYLTKPDGRMLFILALLTAAGLTVMLGVKAAIGRIAAAKRGKAVSL